MRNPKQRLRRIELTLMPQQIVKLWLEKARLAGSLEDAALQAPFPREAVTNAISDMVRSCMKKGTGEATERARLGPDGV
jgi:hypothetical protein